MCTQVQVIYMHARVRYTKMNEPIVWGYVSNMCVPVECGCPLLAGVRLCMHYRG